MLFWYDLISVQAKMYVLLVSGNCQNKCYLNCSVNLLYICDLVIFVTDCSKVLSDFTEVKGPWPSRVCGNHRSNSLF